jgi:hypothetical protein
LGSLIYWKSPVLAADALGEGVSAAGNDSNIDCGMDRLR